MISRPGFEYLRRLFEVGPEQDLASSLAMMMDETEMKLQTIMYGLCMFKVLPLAIMSGVPLKMMDLIMGFG